MSREKLLGWLIPFLIAGAFTVYASYNHNDKELSSRITAVETAQGLDRNMNDSRLNRLEQKVDRVLEILITR